MNEAWRLIKIIFTHPVFQNIVILFTVGIALADIWLGIKLAPLAASQLTLTSKVDAQEVRLTAVEGYIPPVIKMEQQVTDIQTEQIRQGTKLDSIDSFLRGYK